MIELPSKLEKRQYKLDFLEEALKPLGFSIGGNWDYDHGSFDYKMDDHVGYQFVRIPFKVVDGQLDTKGVQVELMRPYILSHKYQIGLDDHVHIGNLSASFDQFQEPQDPDATVPSEIIPVGKQIVKKVEKLLLTSQNKQ
ncbi:YugN-like family protein [Bacillus carboniphilus]|uniref:YugN-like family protein n=1 Tax=Bacillus carboniphilus TaxID=86663 RepID=A0ABY9JPA7_9BACI|nr:YugN-like family protein [Bacillus carboniphilus]WLR41241.1 YugN-like family protein [Bacillus carboniphilus]